MLCSCTGNLSTSINWYQLLSHSPLQCWKRRQRHLHTDQETAEIKDFGLWKHTDLDWYYLCKYLCIILCINYPFMKSLYFMYGWHALEKTSLEVKMQTPQNTGHVGYWGRFKIFKCSHGIVGPITVTQTKNNTASSLESTRLGDLFHRTDAM